MLTPADVNSQTAAAGHERTRKSVDGRMLVNSPRRGSSGQERSTCRSPARIPRLTTTQQADCSPAAVNSSTPKSTAKCVKTSSYPSGTAVHGSPLLTNRRRSPRCLKVDRSEERADEGQKLATSPKRDGAGHVSPVRHSPRSKSAKCPETTLVPYVADPGLIRSLRSSPRKIALPGNDAGSDLVNSGQHKRAASTDSDLLYVSGNVSPRKSVSSITVGAADPVCGRQVTKSVDVERYSLRKNGDDGDEPANDLYKHLSAVPDKVALLFGTTKADKKKTLVRNRRKSSYCGQPEEKRSRGRFRSLEPKLYQKSPRVGRPRRKSDVGIRGEVRSHSAQNQPTLEDSGRQLRRPRKCGINNQCQPTHGNKNLKTIDQKDNPDLSHLGKELAAKKELEDGDESSVSGLDDSVAATASSDDVRNIQSLQICSFYIY